MLRRLMSLFKGCMLLLVIVALAGACVIGVAAGLHIGDEPDTLEVNVQIDPPAVATNGTITITLDITNHDQNAVNMTAVGLDDSLLAGAEIQAADPAYRGVKTRSYPIYGDWHEYRIARRIGPGETLTVTLTLQAIQPGSYSGNLTVWIEGKVLGLLPLDRAWRDTIEFYVS